jgi:hypothetical protein
MSEVFEALEAAPKPRWRKRAALGVAGVVLLTGVGAGAYGAHWYFHTGAQPADALPKSTIAYVSVDFAPAGRQQLAARGLLKKLPIAKSEDLAGVIDVRRELVDLILEDSPCHDLAFDDLKPWLGKRAAFAAVPVDGEPRPVAVLESEDDAETDKGMRELQACGGPDFGGWKVHDGWVVVAEDQDTADAVVAADDDGVLSDESAFTTMIDKAGGPGLVNGYVASDAMKTVLAAFGADAPEELTAKASSEFPTMGMSMRAVDGQLRVDYVAQSPKDPEIRLGGGVDDALAPVPADSSAVVAVKLPRVSGEQLADLRKNARLGFQTALGMSGAVSSQVLDGLGQVQRILGRPFDEVLIDLLNGSSLTAALSHTSLDAVRNAPLDVPAGLRIVPDAGSRDRVFGYYDRLRRSFGQLDGVSGTSGTALALGPSKAFRQQLLDGKGGIADADAFRSVVDLDGAGVFAVAFADLGSGLLHDGIHQGLEAADGRWLANLDHVEAVGVTASRDGRTGRFELRVALR